MDEQQVRATLKEIIGNVASIEPLRIADDASFVEDLQLDSLSLLEIAVEIDCVFLLDGELEERSLQQDVRTLPQAVKLVVERIGGGRRPRRGAVDRPGVC